MSKQAGRKGRLSAKVCIYRLNLNYEVEGGLNTGKFPRSSSFEK